MVVTKNFGDLLLQHAVIPSLRILNWKAKYIHGRTLRLWSYRKLKTQWCNRNEAFKSHTISLASRSFTASRLEKKFPATPLDSLSVIDRSMDCITGTREAMVKCPSLLNGLARTVTLKKGRNCTKDVRREAAQALEREARKNELILNSSGIVNSNRSDNFVSVFSKRGQKGVNQDCFTVWEEFGRQEDMIFCGIFDGHGPWGHLLAKWVRESMPSTLLCNWLETLAGTSLDLDFDMELDGNLHRFEIWKQSYLKTCAAIDQELEQHPSINSFCSGTTALTIVRQGDLIVVANVGDSRAVLATASDDGSLIPVQLTVDFKPNLPQEAERITESKGRVFCLDDEPGVYRVWIPNGETSGLAISRAFGDYCMKDFGLISVPGVTQRNITNRDQFVILATDGVWDVLSNKEAVQIVSSTSEREKSAKSLVECAVRAWKHKKGGIAMDDISAICLFFHTSPPQESRD